MFHGVKPLMCLAAPCAFVALSLTMPVQAQTTNPTVSYLYVGGPDAIHAYYVAADGTMTAMRGAPFLGILNTFIPPVVNGTYMFAWDGDISSYDDLLYLYKIEAGGVLKRVNAIDFGANYDIHFEENMFLDKKGETLYVTGDDFDEQVIHSFQVNWDKGTLTNLGGVEGLPGEPGTTGYFYYPPKFIANDKYLFTGTGTSPEIYGWTRTSNGSLAAGPSTPVAPLAPVGYAAIPGTVAAADPANHLVLTYFFREGDSSGAQWGPEQLAVFTADALGNLTTTDTYLTMPADAVGAAFNIQFSPSGKLIAISGPAGLQFFHFDGVHITPYTGLVSTASFAYFRWDNSSHLYAFDSNTGKLHIFNATPTSVTEAPGSPHRMPFPVSFDYAGFTVQSLN